MKKLIGFIVFLVIVSFLPYGCAYLLTHPLRNLEYYYPSERNLSFKEVTFKSRDKDIQLKGWIIPVENSHNWVILSHGYTENRNLFPKQKEKSLEIFEYFNNKGYNVLTFDYRRSGQSEGDYVSIGYYEQNDLKGAIDLVRQKDNEAKIGLMGWSQGAAVSLMVGSRENVEWIVADSSYADLSEYLEGNLSYWTKLPNHYFTPSIMKYLSRKTKINPTYISPITYLNDCQVPVLLIHSKSDKAIPYENSKKMFEQYRTKFKIELVTFSESAHIESFLDHEEDYLNKITRFIFREETTISKNVNKFY